MASSAIKRGGNQVILRLSFREAAALHALIVRCGPTTHPQVADDTMDAFCALEAVKEKVQGEDAELWNDGDGIQEFAMRTSDLIDPEETHQVNWAY